jgi:ABC-type amino acid transport substrate-binding protein
MAINPSELGLKVKRISDATAALNLANSEFSAAKVYEAEMQRQYNWWNGEGADANNASVVYPQLIAARAATATKANIVNTAQAEFNAAQKAYDDYVAGLSAEDTATLNAVATNQSQAALNNSVAAAAVATQATTKYLIFGAIALTIIVGIVIVIRSQTKIA